MTIYINLSPGKGLGVFAAKAFKKGEHIETCPILILSPKDCENIDKTEMLHYYYLWGTDESRYAVCWGYGSLYNHSHEPNAEFIRDFDNNRIVFQAIKDIKKGEEICTDYDWDVDETTPEWFRKGRKHL